MINTGIVFTLVVDSKIGYEHHIGIIKDSVLRTVYNASETNYVVECININDPKVKKILTHIRPGSIKQFIHIDIVNDYLSKAEYPRLLDERNSHPNYKQEIVF